MHIQFNYILCAPLKQSRQYIFKTSTYKPINNHLNTYGVLQFTMYFYKYCLILLIFHRIVITVWEIRNWPGLLTSSPVCFLLPHTSFHYSPTYHRTKILQLNTVSDNIYIPVTRFNISILSLYDDLDQFSPYFYLLLVILFCFLNWLYNDNVRLNPS